MHRLPPGALSQSTDVGQASVPWFVITGSAIPLPSSSISAATRAINVVRMVRVLSNPWELTGPPSVLSDFLESNGEP